MKITVDKALIEQAIDTIGYYASVCGEDDQETPAKQTQAALRAALAEPAVEPVGDGWQLRHVYFQDGEPTMHKAPPAEVPLLSDAEVGMLTVYGGLHHVDVPLLAEFVRHIESTIRRKAGLK